MSPPGAGPDHICLLRGVNVGGHNRMAMAAFTQCLLAAGCSEVRTYIQSGNAAFRWDGDVPTDLASRVHDEIERAAGIDCSVVALSAGQLEAVMAANPFVHEPDPKKVHVVFYAGTISAEMQASLGSAMERARVKGSSDEAVVGAAALYLHTPVGFGRSILAAELAKMPRQGAGTARNWATVTALARLVGLPAPAGAARGSEPGRRFV